MRLTKKADNVDKYSNLPEPISSPVLKEKTPDKYYMYGVYENITEEDINNFNSVFPDVPMSLMMINTEGNIFYGAFSQSPFFSFANNYCVIADNGARGFSSQVITNNVQILNQFMPYVIAFMGRNDFDIYLSNENSLKFGTLLMNQGVQLIARSQKEFNQYLFQEYLKNRNTDTAIKFKRLIKKGDNTITRVNPIYPSQKPILDLRKQQQNLQHNQQKKQNNEQPFDEILKRELSK